MRRIFVMALAAIIYSVVLPAAADGGVAGTWNGPWYRGMTSGIMTLEVAADGTGSVEFTNLDNFGEERALLSQVEITDSGLEFRATGAGASTFVAKSRLDKGGTMLRGTARYEGFGVRFELQRR